MKARKILACLTAALMVFSMSYSVFAVDNPSLTSAITIEKNLKVSNPDLTSVDGPGVTFTYAIASETPSAANGGTTITDANDKTGTVHAGPAAGVTLSTSTIEYPIGTAVNASPTGADNIKSITATADVTKFSAPGIYRYKITETSSGKDTCGVENTDGIRYIDVYIENDGDNLKVAGVVMHTGETEDGAPSEKDTFDDASFETVNITLKKTVAGAMGDKDNQFPFAGTVTDSNRYFYAKKAEAPAAVDANKVTTGSISTTLCHDETYYISGLSHNAAVAYTETNNTSDAYNVNYTGGTASAVTAGGTKAMESTDVDDAGAITFTNTLDSVSPTGVIMRYGPYAGILVAAIVLLVLKRKSVQNN